MTPTRVVGRFIWSTAKSLLPLTVKFQDHECLTKLLGAGLQCDAKRRTECLQFAAYHDDAATARVLLANGWDSSELDSLILTEVSLEVMNPTIRNKLKAHHPIKNDDDVPDWFCRLGIDPWRDTRQLTCCPKENLSGRRRKSADYRAQKRQEFWAALSKSEKAMKY